MLALDWPQQFYHEPAFHFTYYGFGWVTPPPPGWFETLILVATSAAISLAIGWHTRISAAIFACCFTWIELCDISTYLNHYYLVSLLSFLLIYVPSAATWSLDARHRNKQNIPPILVRKRHRWLLCGQIAIVYTCAGLAKCHADWLFHGVPLHLWLARYGDIPLIGSWFEMRETAIAASWCGFLYDLSIPWLLAWRRSHRLAMIAVILFHVITWLLFPIGLFPWIMIASSLAFWPTAHTASPSSQATPRRFLYPAICCVGIWLVIQALWPWRFIFHPGDVRWHEQGFRFGWRVMVMEKTGIVSYRVVKNDGTSQHLDPAHHLAPHQVKQLSTQPDMILAFAQHIAQNDSSITAIYADAWVSLNGRTPAQLINPHVNLINLSNTWDRTDYVLPEPSTLSGGWVLMGWETH